MGAIEAGPFAAVRKTQPGIEHKEYSAATEKYVREQYRDVLYKVATYYSGYFERSQNGKLILRQCVNLSNDIQVGNPSVRSINKLTQEVQKIVDKIKAFCLEENHRIRLEVSLDVKHTILARFPEYGKAAKFWQQSSPVQKLQHTIDSTEDIKVIQQKLSVFSSDMQIQGRVIPLDVEPQILKIGKDITKATQYEHALAAILAEIEFVPVKIEIEVKREDGVNKEHAKVSTAVATYVESYKKPNEDIATRYHEKEDYDEIIITIPPTADTDMQRAKIRVAGIRYKEAIDNKTTFNRNSFSASRLNTIVEDLRQQANLQAQFSAPERDTMEIKTPFSRRVFFAKLRRQVSNGWNYLKNIFKPVVRRRSAIAAFGLAALLGLGLAGRHTTVHHEQEPLPTPVSLTPATPVHTALPNQQQETPQVRETPAPTTVSNHLVVHQSTSEGSRYSLASHNHNTNETLQRLVSSMGFNSVQTKVISTRLDNQLMAARGIQAPHTHTHANQTVTLEQDNTGSQIRLSVQDASGHSLYQTGWFAKEIGFRNFTARR